MISELFARLAGTYKQRFFSQYQNENDIKLDKMKWGASELKYFTDSEIRKAIERCESELKWPPNLPEFIEVVRSVTDLGDIEGVYRKVCSTKFYELSPLEQAAASKTGLFDLKNNSANQMKPLFAKNYRELWLKQRAGADLPKYLAAPEEEKKPKAKPEFAKPFLEKIKQDLGG